MRKILLCILLASGWFSGAAAAADEPPLVTGNVQFMTNYVGRGLAQSLGNPSVEGELDVNNNTDGGFYGGIDANSINWIDALYPGDDVGMEVDGWAGWRQRIDQDWLWKAGVLRLQFPGNYARQTPPVAEPNTTEAYGYIAWRSYSLRVNYSVTDSFGTPDTKGSLYIDMNGSQYLGGHFTLGEHLGRNQKTGSDPVTGASHSANDYTDYKLSLVCDLRQGLSLTLAHTWTNGDPARYTLNGYFVGGHHTWLLLEKDF
ncbi:MAG TPA: TorF family putative porin [Gammaproteobacteria bacterium]